MYEIKPSNKLNLQKRIFLFLIGCMGTRYGMSYLSYKKPEYNIYISIFTILAGLGFLIIYFGGYRKTGLETGGEKIWWNKLRLVHGIIYLLFSYIVLINNNCNVKPWKLLTLDASIGLISFLFYHTFGKI
jgi:hypothetical protein